MCVPALCAQDKWRTLHAAGKGLQSTLPVKMDTESVASPVTRPRGVALTTAAAIDSGSELSPQSLKPRGLPIVPLCINEDEWALDLSD